MNWRFDGRGWLKHLEFTAIVAIVTAIACVMIGQSAERYASNAGEAVAQSQPADKNSPAFNAIDYATTGSIKGRSVVLSPCAAEPAPR
jgi:UDP-N-acetylmuramoylalanine-D-glutamate ligase